MQTVKIIKNEIQTVQQVKNMLTSLQELYVNRMQKVKDSILLSRDYYEGLFYILAEVLHEKEMRFTNKGQEGTSQNKQLVILFSGSKKFAGSINRKVFNDFQQYIRENTCEIIIIGKIGRELFAQHDIKNPYDYFDWAEDSNKTETIHTIARKITQYPIVKLFFAQYVNLTFQKSLQVNLYEGLKDEIMKKQREKSQYIYEPNKKKVTEFFETRVLEAYLYHTLQELYLALIGSRVFRMEESSTNAKKLLKVLDHLHVVTIKNRKNRNQLSNVTRITNIRRSYSI